MGVRVRRTDQALLRRLGGMAGSDGSNGSEGGWETFFAIYYPQVLRLARERVKNLEMSQDIASEVMIKLVRRLQKGWKDDPGKGGFEALLGVIVKHCAATYVSQQIRQLGYADELPADDRLEEELQRLDADGSPLAGDEVSLVGELPEGQRLLEAALGDLSETDRRVLVYDGKLSELAKELDVKPGALRARRFRAMKRLREALRQRMVRWQTELRPGAVNGFAIEHLTWAGQLILDQKQESASGPDLLFRRRPSEPEVESIRLEARTDIGRDTFADLDPPLFDPEVSGSHCRIEYLGAGSWRIQDLGARNPTAVNGRRLAEKGAAALRDGDRLEIGRQLLVFSTGELGPEEAP